MKAHYPLLTRVVSKGSVAWPSRRPLISIPAAYKELGLSEPTVAKAVDHLISLKIVREVTGKRRGRMFAYVRYLDILTQGTEPIR
jgi:Fic family protein